MHELIQLCQTDPITVFIILGIAGATIVGIFKYLAFIITRDKAVLTDDDE